MELLKAILKAILCVVIGAGTSFVMGVLIVINKTITILSLTFVAIIIITIIFYKNKEN